MEQYWQDVVLLNLFNWLSHDMFSIFCFIPAGVTYCDFMEFFSKNQKAIQFITPIL